MWRGDDESKRRWPVRLFLTGVVFFIGSGLVYMIFGGSDPRYTRQPAPVSGPSDQTAAGIGDPILLQKDRDCLTAHLKLVYRGVEGGRLRFDATLLQLDPEYAYIHHVAPDIAEKEFQMGGHTFRLLTWSRSRARLERLR